MVEIYLQLKKEKDLLIATGIIKKKTDTSKAEEENLNIIKKPNPRWVKKIKKKMDKQLKFIFIKISPEKLLESFN